jgi:hypothetical protein
MNVCSGWQVLPTERLYFGVDCAATSHIENVADSMMLLGSSLVCNSHHILGVLGCLLVLLVNTLLVARLLHASIPRNKCTCACLHSFVTHSHQSSSTWRRLIDCCLLFAVYFF